MINKILIICIFCCITTLAHTQFTTVSGTVYDISAKRGLEAVAVFSTSGRNTITDSAGRYSLTVKTTDSIWFSLIGKTTIKYAVDTIDNIANFNLMLHINATQLPAVTVRNRYYKLDSLQNRQDYAKIFNFKKPTLQLVQNPSYSYTPGVTVGLDINEIINLFRFKRNKQLLAFQRRLLQQEQDAYINHRFKKLLVIKLTGLKDTALESFMTAYRPDYELLITLNDLEFGYYIQRCFELYKEHKPSPFKGLFKNEAVEEY